MSPYAIVSVLAIAAAAFAAGAWACFRWKPGSRTSLRRADASSDPAIEERSRSVVDGIQAAIAYWDSDLRCQFVNRAHVEAYGRSLSQMRGLELREFLPAEFYDRHIPLFREVLEGRPRMFEADYTDKEGSVSNLQISCLPDRVHGRVAGFFVLVTDITDWKRKLAEHDRRLVAAKETAEAANRAKDNMISNVSHEMRTPLHAIMSFANLGRRRLDESNVEKCRGYFERIHASGERLAHFVDNLLDLARLGAGEVHLHRVETDFGSLVRKIADDLAPLLDEKELTVGIGLPPQGLSAYVDPLLIERALVNLLSNAMKFSPHGTVIDVSIERRPGGHEGGAAEGPVRIAVSDRGPGIPEGELESIFSAFVQSSRTDRRSGGTGLGLPIVRGIVELHGGRVTARNNDHGGATFEIVVPCTPARAEPSRSDDVAQS